MIKENGSVIVSLCMLVCVLCCFHGATVSSQLLAGLTQRKQRKHQGAARGISLLAHDVGGGDELSTSFTTSCQRFRAQKEHAIEPSWLKVEFTSGSAGGQKSMKVYQHLIITHTYQLYPRVVHCLVYTQYY